MTANNLLETMCAQNPERWEFIVSKMDSHECDEVAQRCINSAAAAKKANEELGLHDDEQTDDERVINNCWAILARESTKRMWKAISKDQANSLLRSMQEVGAVSIKMPGGIEYTPKQIVDTWRECNGGEAE